MEDRSIRVLHVEDDPDFADLTAIFLERESGRFAVETVTDPNEGLARVEDHPPDCVVSDYEMPGMNGIELLRAVRSRYPDLPFILFTGKGSEEVASDAISAGVTDYLNKAGGTQQYELLATRVHNAVEKARMEAERQRRLHAIETAREGIAFLDSDFRFITVNEAYADLFGYDPEEMVGESWRLLYDEETIEEEVGEIGAALGDQEYYRGEQTFRRADGSSFVADHVVSQTEGQEYVCLVRDVTERKEHERELREQREQLQRREEKLIRLRDYTQELMYAETPSETASVALRAVDEILGFDLGAVFVQSETQDGVLESVGILNRSRMERMYGGIPVFMRDAPPGTHSELVWDVFESGEAVFINDTAESAVLARKSPFGSLMVYPIGDHGVVLLAATILEAFTETEEILLDLLATALETACDRLDRERALRRQRDELERKNERLEEFASVVSHDLRSPLHVAGGHLELARTETDATDHLDAAATALDRMEKLIDDLLTLAQEGEKVAEAESVVVADVAGTSWQTVATEKATLETDVSRRIQADRGRLRQLFANLFRNAVEHGGSEVTVRVGVTDGGFYVADTGRGIPESNREKIFEAGYSSSENGTGFGLRIVEQVVEAHGWEITVTESEQGGARFEITGIDTME
ncbi:hybrid sensor histidine kinase/response regulator [Halobacteriales archaeon SW_10_68_16]|nr:MAG: hybrid sensor histidine kinase/response regulator [Halobacteriales archaeon SW_10_68_16]